VLLQALPRHCEGGGREGTLTMVSVPWMCTCACVTHRLADMRHKTTLELRHIETVETRATSMYRWKVFWLAILAGAYIGLGAAFFLSVGGQMPGVQSTNLGLQSCLGSIWPAYVTGLDPCLWG